MSNDDGSFYIALKFKQGELDLTDGRSGYRYKPGGRMYPKKQPASAMRRRWLNEGYDARIARLWVDEDGPHIEWCDQDDNIKPVCLAKKHTVGKYPGASPYVTHTCVLDAGHSGWHCTTRTPNKYNAFQADA